MYYARRRILPLRGGWATVQMSTPARIVKGLMNWEVSRKNPIAIPKIKKICKAVLRKLTPNYLANLLQGVPRQMQHYKKHISASKSDKLFSKIVSESLLNPIFYQCISYLCHHWGSFAKQLKENMCSWKNDLLPLRGFDPLSYFLMPFLNELS